MPITRTLARRALLAVLGTAALAGAVGAAPAAAADYPASPKLLSSIYRSEGAGEVQYRVTLPCPENRYTRGQWAYYRVCDYTITPNSGTAFYNTPDVGGDAYTYRRQITGTARKQAVESLPIRIVDDRVKETTEILNVDIRIKIRECHVWMGNGGRYPNCSYDTGIRRWYRSQIVIIDNER
jgi:hypothetical protein